MKMKERQTSPGIIEQRKRWFEWYKNQKAVMLEPRNGEAYACPCCGCLTLGERGGYEICPVCFWEDDGQDEDNADLILGGPNGSLSLTQARRNFQEYGACDRRHLENVREPLPEERP